MARVTTWSSCLYSSKVLEEAVPTMREPVVSKGEDNEDEVALVIWRTRKST